MEHSNRWDNKVLSLCIWIGLISPLKSSNIYYELMPTSNLNILWFVGLGTPTIFVKAGKGSVKSAYIR